MNFAKKLMYLVRTEWNFRTLEDRSTRPVDRGILPHADHSVSHEQKRAIVDRIINAYSKAKRAQENIPSEYLPGHKWAPQIEVERQEFIEALRKRDAPLLVELFDDFFRNSGSVSILKYARYSQLAGTSGIKSSIARRSLTYNLYRDLQTWKSATRESSYEQLRTPMIGNPYGYYVDDVLVTPAACPANYYAQAIRKILKPGKSRIVAEIGGGIGTVGYFLIRNNPEWTYIDFDLPEVLVIAQYYLLAAYPEKRVLFFGEAESQEVNERVLADYDILLLPNFALPALQAASLDLLFNIHSLSEMDPATIEEYVRQVSRVTREYFFHENSESPKRIGYGHAEVPSSSYPMDQSQFELVYRAKAIWREPRYWEYLYKKHA